MLFTGQQNLPLPACKMFYSTCSQKLHLWTSLMEISAEKLTGKQKFLKVYFMSLQQ